MLLQTGIDAALFIRPVSLETREQLIAPVRYSTAVLGSVASRRQTEIDLLGLSVETATVITCKNQLTRAIFGFDPKLCTTMYYRGTQLGT